MKRESSPARESRAGKQLARARRREELRVAIERNAAHHQAGPRIPGIVLPQPNKPPSASARCTYQRVEALLGIDVMEDAVAVGESTVPTASRSSGC